MAFFYLTVLLRLELQSFQNNLYFLFSYFICFHLLFLLLTVQLREASSKRHHNAFTNSFYKFLKVFMYFNNGLALNFAIKCNFVLWQFK